MAHEVDMPWGTIFYSKTVGYGVQTTIYGGHDQSLMPQDAAKDLQRYWSDKYAWIERWYPDVLPILEELANHDKAEAMEDDFRRDQKSVDFKIWQQEVKKVFDDKMARDCFIRFGPLPKSGRSWNHRDGVFEKGVSVYAARCLKDVTVIDMRDVDYVSAQFIMNGQAYRVVGDVVGRGGDGEPLLKNATARKFNGNIEVLY